MIPMLIYFYFSPSFSNPVVDMVNQLQDGAGISTTYAIGELRVLINPAPTYIYFAQSLP
jgi:hypothetical protein